MANKKRFKQLQFLAVLLALFLLLPLAACSKDKTTEDKDNPYLGLWHVITVEMFEEEYPADEIFEGGVSLELLSGGKCKYVYEHIRENYTYEIKGNNISVDLKDQNVLVGKIDENFIIVDDYQQTGMKMIFAKEGSAAVRPTQESSEEPLLEETEQSDEEDPFFFEIEDDDNGLTESETESLWDGGWYGYWRVLEVSGDFEELEDIIHDAYLMIESYDDGSSYMEIYLSDDGTPTVAATILTDEHHFEVEEGFFWNMELDPSVWWLGLAPADEGKRVVIADTYIDPSGDNEGSLEYMFVFRPVGELWEQEEKEGALLPPSFEDYKDEMILTGGKQFFGIDSAAQDGQLLFTVDELEIIYQNLKKDFDKGLLAKKDYAEIRDSYFGGLDGALTFETDTMSEYFWYAEGSNEQYYVLLKFYDDEGNEPTAKSLEAELP